MLKSLLAFSTVILFALTTMPSQGSKPQQTAPEAAPASAPASAPDHPPPTTKSNPVKPTAESQAKAKNFYQIDCAMCHGDNGNGQTDITKSMGLTIPDFTDPKGMSGKPDGVLFDSIRNGKDKMPPEEAGRANDTMVWNLIIYIRNISKSQPMAPAK
jgi:mono/diheme cytochrome c family protein